VTRVVSLLVEATSAVLNAAFTFAFTADMCCKSPKRSFQRSALCAVGKWVGELNFIKRERVIQFKS
jgi:hypothetical protein